jgi:hypothetical protein
MHVLEHPPGCPGERGEVPRPQPQHLDRRDHAAPALPILGRGNGVHISGTTEGQPAKPGPHVAKPRRSRHRQPESPPGAGIKWLSSPEYSETPSSWMRQAAKGGGDQRAQPESAAVVPGAAGAVHPPGGGLAARGADHHSGVGARGQLCRGLHLVYTGVGVGAGWCCGPRPAAARAVTRFSGAAMSRSARCCW